MQQQLTNKQTRRRGYIMTLSLLAMCTTAYAVDNPNLSGQWIGNSLLEGQHETAKTTLSLGALDADDATLRIEDRSVCTLQQGTYSARQNADGAAAWSLTFKQAHGGEACERLARGEFSLHSGARPRSIEFDVTYPARDGTQNHRKGVLNHYP